MNITDPAEAHQLLEGLPLGKADMMTFAGWRPLPATPPEGDAAASQKAPVTVAARRGVAPKSFPVPLDVSLPPNASSMRRLAQSCGRLQAWAAARRR
jgi:hypothetical protein